MDLLANSSPPDRKHSTSFPRPCSSFPQHITSYAPVVERPNATTITSFPQHITSYAPVVERPNATTITSFPQHITSYAPVVERPNATTITSFPQHITSYAPVVERPNAATITSFPQHITSYPHPLTSFPHPLTSFPRRRESTAPHLTPLHSRASGANSTSHMRSTPSYCPVVIRAMAYCGRLTLATHLPSNSTPRTSNPKSRLSNPCCLR